MYCDINDHNLYENIIFHIKNIKQISIDEINILTSHYEVFLIFLRI